MKRKIVKIIATAGIFALLTGSLAGCTGMNDIVSRLGNGSSEVTSEITSVTVPESETVSDTGWEKPVGSGDSGEGTDTGSTGTVTDADADADAVKTACEDFINGNEKIYVEYEYTEVLEEGSSYTIDEMVDFMNKEIPDNWGPAGMYVMEVGYAYIDCGNDGIPEIALYVDVNNDEYYDLLTEFYIIKLKDGKLCVVDNFSQQGRSMCEINKYGIYHPYGSSGAALWYDGYYRITADGKHEFIYDKESMFDLEGPVIYGHQLPSGAKAPKGVPDFAEEYGDYTGYAYGFKEYTEEMYGDEAAYDEYKKSKVYIFYDPDNKICFPSDEDEKIYFDAGITITDEDNLNEMIAGRLHELGLSEEEMKFDDGEEYAPKWVVAKDYVHTEGQGGEN